MVLGKQPLLWSNILNGARILLTGIESYCSRTFRGRISKRRDEDTTLVRIHLGRGRRLLTEQQWEICQNIGFRTTMAHLTHLRIQHI